MPIALAQPQPAPPKAGKPQFPQINSQLPNLNESLSAIKSFKLGKDRR